MAASTWRMNGLWRRTARVLVLCALLLSNEVMCQDATDAPVTDAAVDADPVTDAADSPAAPNVTAAPDVGSAPTAAAADEAADEAAASAASAASGHISFPATVLSILNPENQNGGASWATVGPVTGEMTAVPVDSNVVQPVVPDVKCVGEEEIQESNALKVEVGTADCEETKQMIQENPAPWCPKEKCNLEIFQDGSMLSVTSNDAKLSTLAEVLQSEHLKDKLGVTNVQTPPSSSSSVFVGILVTGLLAALAIILGYFKCQRRSETKGVRLAEEAYPVDQENQGNTLVSVAPLNPPPETQEKPSVNGESPEAAKTEPPPPTNGHSAAKTADTEL